MGMERDYLGYTSYMIYAQREKWKLMFRVWARRRGGTSMEDFFHPNTAMAAIVLVLDWVLAS